VPLRRRTEHRDRREDASTPLPDGRLRTGASVRKAEAVRHPLARQHDPPLAQPLLAGAPPQLRNMATMRGQLMQRTRCYGF
jgi:xanthine dehydrogenase YagS FAD-binding subunit